MKAALLLVALAALLSYVSCAVVPSSGSSALSEGTINPGDQVLTTFKIRQAEPTSSNPTRFQEITQKFVDSVKITAIRGTQLTSSPEAKIWVVAGGVGKNTVTIRAEETKGDAFEFKVEVWGHN